MVFKLRMLSGETDGFVREYEVSESTDLLQLHDLVCGDLGYDPFNFSTDIPLVLHGCTGMEESIIKDAIRLGVAKINFGTEIRYKYVQHYQEGLDQLEHQGHSWKLSQFANEALTKDVENIIRLSGSAGTV